MYYCSRSKSKEYSIEKIHERMTVLAEQIRVVALQPYTGESDIVGDLDFGHPLTELMVEYRVLIFWALNPPDPRGDQLFSRPAPYFIHVSTKELALAIGKSIKTTERAKKLVHEKLGLKLRADITVDEFCKMFEYSEEERVRIHQKLADIREGKWKNIRDRHRNKEEDE